MTAARARRYFRELKLPVPTVTVPLPVVIGVRSAGVALFQCHEQWIEYRPAAEVLGRERHLYQARAMDSQGEGQDWMAGRIEELLPREGVYWTGSEHTAEREPGASR